MILTIILIIIAGLYSFSFYFTHLSLWFYFLWIPLSLVLSLITYILFIVVIFQYFKRTDPKGKFRHHLLYQTCEMVLLFANVKITVIGKENIPNEPFVCYANHKSDLDPVILYHSLHRICSAVGKKSLFRIPIFKQCQQVFKAISLDRDNDREAAKAIIEGIRAVKDGMSYIIFPEGGIKSRETEKMVDLKAGAYKLVTKSEAVLLPATILGSSKLKGRCILKRVKIKVIIHQAMNYEMYKDYHTNDLGNTIMELVNKDVIENEKNLH